MTVPGLLLCADQVALYAPHADEDGHGWALPGDSPYWEGTGNLQLSPGASDPQAAAGGGRGPFGPHAAQTGQLFLPPECPLAEGSAALVRGSAWAVGQVHLVIDPTVPGGGIACQVATVTSTGQWSAEGEDDA